jgi:hypothetical protein
MCASFLAVAGNYSYMLPIPAHVARLSSPSVSALGAASEPNPLGAVTIRSATIRFAEFPQYFEDLLNGLTCVSQGLSGVACLSFA